MRSATHHHPLTRPCLLSAPNRPHRRVATLRVLPTVRGLEHLFGRWFAPFLMRGRNAAWCVAASVAVAGVLAAVKATNTRLQDHTFLFQVLAKCFQ